MFEDDDPLHSARIRDSGCRRTSGWLGIDLDDDTDWREIAELIDASFRVTAPRRLSRELDAR